MTTEKQRENTRKTQQAHIELSEWYWQMLCKYFPDRPHTTSVTEPRYHEKKRLLKYYANQVYDYICATPALPDRPITMQRMIATFGKECLDISERQFELLICAPWGVKDLKAKWEAEDKARRRYERRLAKAQANGYMSIYDYRQAKREERKRQQEQNTTP